MKIDSGTWCLIPQLLAAGCITTTAYADTATKSGSGTDLTGATAGVWSGGLGTNGSPTGSDVATWDTSSLGGSLTAASNVNWGSINITGATANIAISGAGQIATGNVTLAGNRTLSIANAIALSGNSIYDIADVTSSTAGDATLSGVISGAGFGITKTGGGTLTINGTANTYSGGTLLNGGTLALGATTTTLGAAANTLAVGAGNSATLDLLGNANRTVTSGTITLNTGSQLTITRSEVTNQSSTAFTGALSGAGNLVIGAIVNSPNTTSPHRRTTFSSATAFDNFTGSITVQSGANLALLNGTLTSANSNNLTIDTGGYVTLFGAATTFVGALNGGGSIAKNGAADTATLSVASGTFSGTINPGLLLGAGTIALTKTSNGTLTLSGTNAYSGATTINGGTLEAKAFAAHGTASSIGTGGAQTLANSAQTLAINGGTLKFSGTTGNGSTNRLFTFGTNGATLDGSSSDNTALTFTNTGSLATTAGAADRTLTLTGTSAAGTLNSLASVIVDPTGGGKTAVNKTGANTWLLTGANTYTGGTSVQQGKLGLGAAGTISSTLVLGTNSGGTGTLDVTAKSSFTQANVAGNGTLDIGVGKTINVTTTLAAGFSTGTLNLIGNLALAGTTITTMELAGSGGASGVDSDYVNVSNDLTLDGILNITSYGGFNLAQEGSYNLFDAATLTGSFDDVNVGDLTNLIHTGTIWSTSSEGLTYSFDETNGVLTVVPEPASAVLGGIGLLLLLRRRRS